MTDRTPLELAFRWAGDVLASGVIVSTFLNWLPAVAGFLAVIWYCFQIWESKTVQKWAREYQRKRYLMQLAKTSVEAQLASELAKRIQSDANTVADAAAVTAAIAKGATDGSA